MFFPQRGLFAWAGAPPAAALACAGLLWLPAGWPTALALGSALAMGLTGVAGLPRLRAGRAQARGQRQAMKASPLLVDAARGGDAQAIAQLLTQCQPAPQKSPCRTCSSAEDAEDGAGRPVAALPQDRRAA